MPAEGPWMWIIAGSNGAGKSTFRDEFFEELGLGGILKLMPMK
jgi:predicted ABC-type ATPase